MKNHIRNLSLKLHYFILSILMTIIYLASHAQAPSFGIYKRLSTSDNIFPTSYYAPYIVNPGTSFKVNLTADEEVQYYGLEYALISIDTTAHIMKFVFLRDTVSEKSKKMRKLPWSFPIADASSISLSNQFNLLGDSVDVSGNVIDPYFPTPLGLSGNLVFNKLLNWDNLFAFVNLPPFVKQDLRYDSINQKYQKESSYTFEESFFQPYCNLSPYIDLLYNNENIPVYAKANSKAKIIAHFEPGEYIAVINDSANWLCVNKIIVLPDTAQYYFFDYGTKKGDTKLKIVSGWIKQEDEWEPWIKQKQQTKNFRFEVSGSYNGNNDPTYLGQIDAIKIINKKTGKVQIISQIAAQLYNSLNDVVQVQDCNFDGYPDFWIYDHNGGAGPNDGNNFYLYNPQNGQFKFNQPLSDLTQVEVDSKTKTITSAFRDGCCHHGGAVYTFIKGKMDTLSTWDSYYGQGYFYKNTDEEKFHGKWETKVFYTFSDTAPHLRIFDTPNDSATSSGYLPDESNINTGNNLWFRVEDGKKTSNGWVKKEAVLDSLSGKSIAWVKYKAETSKYYFEKDDSDVVHALKITDKITGKPFQIMVLNNFFNGYDASDSLFQTGDYNFDGYGDFRIRSSNSSDMYSLYDYYLYNPSINSFEIDSKLSNSPNQ